MAVNLPLSRGHLLLQLSLNKNKEISHTNEFRNFQIQGSFVTESVDENEKNQCDGNENIQFENDVHNESDDEMLYDSCDDPVWKPKRKEMLLSSSDSETDCSNKRKRKRRKPSKNKQIKKDKTVSITNKSVNETNAKINDIGKEILRSAENREAPSNISKYHINEEQIPFEKEVILEEQSRSETVPPAQPHIDQNNELEREQSEAETQTIVDRQQIHSEKANDMETTQEPKKPRKRNPSDWERNKQKALRMQGKEYKGMTKIGGH